MSSPRPLLLTFLAALLALAAWMMLGDVGGGSAAEEEAVFSGAPEGGAALPAVRGEDVEVTTSGEVQREDAPEPAEGTPAATDTADERPLIVMTGRCVAAESGEPLAGCEVKLHGWGTNSQDMAMRPDMAWEDPAPIVTGADGTFALEFPDVAPFQYSLTIRTEGRVDRRGRWSTDLTADTPRHFGDLALRRGVIVHGQVVDQDGGQVPDATIYVSGVSGIDVDNPRSADTAYGRSEDGKFTLSTAVPPGTYPIDVRVDGYLYMGEEMLEVPDGVARHEVRLEMQAMPSISGVVQFADGTPVPRARVEAERRGSGWMASSRTAEDGTFRVHAASLDREPFPLSVSGADIESMVSEELHEWGDTNVVLVVRPAMTMALTVVEAGSGVPVEEYALRCHPLEGGGGLQTDVRLGGQHAGGTVAIPGVQQGTNVLQVLPWDPALRESERIEFEVDAAGPEPMTVELERMAPLAVRVVGPGDRPVEGAIVDVVDQPLEDPEEMVDESRTGRSRIYTTSRNSFPKVLSTDESGVDGLADLHYPGSLVEGCLRVQVAGRKSVFPLVRPLEQEQPIIVRVAGVGKVRGVLLHAQAGEGGMRLSCRAEGQPMFRMAQLDLDSDGRFEGELAAGTYLAYLSRYREIVDGASTSGHWNTLEPDLVRFTIEDGRTTELEIDGSGLEFGSLSGQVTMDGEPCAGAQLYLNYRPPVEKPSSWGMYDSLRTDAAGRFRADELPPGTWTVVLRLGEGRSSSTLTHPLSVELAPGAEVSQDYAFRLLTVVVRVLHPDTGEPVPDLELLRDGDPDLTVKTDAEGRARVEGAPFKPFRLYGKLDDIRIRVGPLTADPERSVTELEAVAERVE